MGRGATIESRGHVTGFCEEIDKAASKGGDAFFTWFDSASNADVAFARGREDFRFHIAEPALKYLDNPAKLTALEIGYGGGRLLAAACKYFESATGVDIHTHGELVAGELKKRGITNFRLLETAGDRIPLCDSSVDFIYSFIVLQHVEKIDTFNAYFREASRVIKPGGVAVLYFGRRAAHSHGRSSAFFYLLDRIMEAIVLRGRYLEMPAVVNDVNLIVSLAYARRLAERCEFRVLGNLVSRKNVPDGGKLYGIQHGLILRREAAFKE